MNPDDAKKSPDPALRAQAEAQLVNSLPPEVSSRPAEELLHELRVHQIELEMLNEALRQTQQALEESRDRFVDLYEFAPVGYLTLNADGMIAEINLTAVTLLGRDRIKLINRSLRTLVIAADHDRWVRHLMRIKQQPEMRSIELSLQRGDGTVFHAQLDCVGNAAMVRITLSDITNRKLAENELGLMQFTIDHAPDAVYRMTPEGRFLYVNKMACQTLGYSAEELLTMSVADIDPNLPFGVSVEMAHATKIAGNTKIESEHRSKVGRTFPVEILVSYFEHEGKDYHCSFARDISDRKQVEQKLSASIHAREEKELAKSRFLSAAGHDLRQPLAAASLFIDALRFTHPNPEQHKIIDRLDQAMSNFDVLLDTLLNVSKLDAGVISPEITSISVTAIFSWLDQTFAQMCANKQLRFKFFIPLNTSLAVRADLGLLKSVLLNLVGNSIKFTSRGGILVSARQRGENILFQVWDTGVGIQAESLEKIFDDFYQINNPQRDRAQGLGLGLSIAKRTLALFDGKITCRSQFGRGSVFGFQLPIENSPCKETEVSNASESTELEAIGQFVKGKRFIIVEDDALVSEALAKILTILGGAVESFYDAEVALQETNFEKADCYIVDHMLPGNIDGTNFLRRLHQKIHKPVCAVMMSGNTSTEFIKNSEYFNWPVVHKPVDIVQLINRLSEQCGKSS
jgi:PAS domain S-box-containing protein